MGHRLITAVTQPLAIDGNEIRVGMSVGVAMSARRENPAELIALADRAMYQAKRSGSGGVAMLDEQPSAQAWELTNSPASGSARGDAS
jgi:GGDEF domain-containing protein